MGMALPQQVRADARMSVLVEQLRQGQVSEARLQGKGMQGAGSLFLLGWLYDQGRYGVAKNPERARELLQQAAELGQFDAMHYCWSDCLTLTPVVLRHLRQGVEQGQLQALYLQALYLRDVQSRDGYLLAESLPQSSNPLSSPAQSESLTPAEPQELFERAAKRQHVDAMGEVYIGQFIEWAAQKRELAEAESKLQTCVGEGLTVCYYLLGALYQKHNDPQWALFYYQVLSLADPELYRRYQAQSQIDRLLAQRPQSDLGVVRSRAASYLVQRGVTGNQQIDRFQRCSLADNLACVERVSQADQQCLLGYFAASHLKNLRNSPGYQDCIAQLGRN